MVCVCVGYSLWLWVCIAWRGVVCILGVWVCLPFSTFVFPYLLASSSKLRGPLYLWFDYSFAAAVFTFRPYTLHYLCIHQAFKINTGTTPSPMVEISGTIQYCLQVKKSV